MIDLLTNSSTLLTAIIIPSGIVAGIFEYYRNRMGIKRQEYLEISKLKIQNLSQSVTYYAAMGEWYFHFALELEKGNGRDNKLLFYYSCKCLNAHKKWYAEIGQWQFDNIAAEWVIEEFRYFLYGILLESLGFAALDKMRNIVKEDTTYEKFCDSINQNLELLNSFTSSLGSLSTENTKKLINSCKWFVILMSLETYSMYKVWYDDNPYIDDILAEKDLLDYLKKRYPSYYKRIISLESRWMRKRKIVDSSNPGFITEISHIGA